MNVENMNALIARLEWLRKRDTKPTVGFNMELFFCSSLPDRSNHKCRTVACISGYTWMLSEEQKNGRRIPPREWMRRWDKSHWWVADGQAWLGLSSEEASTLFTPPSHCVGEWHKISLARAITALKRAAAGEPAETWWRE